MARASRRLFFIALSSLVSVACARRVASDAVSLPPPSAGTVDALGPTALARRAEACFEDPSCPVARAAEDFLAADARGADVDCFRFAFGTGVAADPARARACFARSVHRAACDGSPELPRLYLATMQVEGQGGPVDRPGAEATLAGCAQDVGVEGVLALRPGGHTDFCEDIGGTTLSMSECAALDDARSAFALQAWRKTIDAGASPAARAALASADAAFARYLEADAAREADQFRGGTLANPTYAIVRSELVAARAAALGDAARTPATDADVAQRESELTKRTAAARTDLDAEGTELFVAADAAFRAYAEAEVAAAIQRGAAPAPLRARLLRDRIERLR